MRRLQQGGGDGGGGHHFAAEFVDGDAVSCVKCLYSVASCRRTAVGENHKKMNHVIHWKNLENSVTTWNYTGSCDKIMTDYQWMSNAGVQLQRVVAL